MKSKITDFIRTQHQKAMIRYFIMASVIVVIELATFVLLNSGLHINYLLATPLSNVLAILLNWYFSRIYAFSGGSIHKRHVEFILVVVASIVGLGIQTIVSAIAVGIFKEAPFIGKILAIIVTFFWNYWARKKYIFSVDN